MERDQTHLLKLLKLKFHIQTAVAKHVVRSRRRILERLIRPRRHFLASVPGAFFFLVKYETALGQIFGIGQLFPCSKEMIGLERLFSRKWAFQTFPFLGQVPEKVLMEWRADKSCIYGSYFSYKTSSTLTICDIITSKWIRVFSQYMLILHPNRQGIASRFVLPHLPQMPHEKHEASLSGFLLLDPRICQTMSWPPDSLNR